MECKNFREKTLQVGRAIYEVARPRLLSAEAWVRAQFSPRGFCGGRTGCESFHRQHHFAAAPNSLLCHLVDAKLARWVQQFHRDAASPHCISSSNNNKLLPESTACLTKHNRVVKFLFKKCDREPQKYVYRIQIF